MQVQMPRAWNLSGKFKEEQEARQRGWDGGYMRLGGSEVRKVTEAI